MTVWFTVKLDDRPGSLARVATALGERGVNITGHRRRGRGHRRRAHADDLRPGRDARGVRRRSALPFEEHDPTGGIEPDAMSVNDLRPGAAGRGSLG